MREYVNLKVKEIKQDYQRKLLEVQQRQDRMTDQIRAFKEMGAAGNYGISFD